MAQASRGRVWGRAGALAVGSMALAQQVLAAGSDNLPMPDSVDPAVFKYAFWGIGIVVGLFVVFKLVKRVLPAERR